VAIGLLSVGAEAGRPLRGFNVLRNVARSWMSRESAFALLFIVVGGLNTLLWASAAGQAVAAIAGAGLVFSQGKILSHAKGIPAWNVPVMPALFLSSGLLGGAGALMLLATLADATQQARTLGALGLLVVAGDLCVWMRYLSHRSGSRTFAASIARLRSGAHAWSNFGLGHLVPAALLAISALSGASAPLPWAGLALLAGGWLAKRALIQRAGLLIDLYEGFGWAEDGANRLGTASSGRRQAA
jgi:DMSO reductase anchor subunit